VFRFAEPTHAQTNTLFTTALWFQHFKDVAEVWRDRPLWRATLGICFFYAVGGYVSMLMPQVGFELERGGAQSGAVASLMLLKIGVGTMFGNLFSALFSRKGIELGLISIGGALLTATLFALGWAVPGSPIHTALLILAGFSTGLFLAPLYAFVQQKAGNHRRGRVLAGIGFLDSIAGLLAYALYRVIASDDALGWSVPAQYFFLALCALLMFVWGVRHIPHQTVCTIMRVVGPIFYRVKTLGRENMPAGGALIICNHLSYIDAVVLQIASPRNVRFVAFAGFAKSPLMRFLFRSLGVIPIAPTHVMKGIRLANWSACSPRVRFRAPGN
jgi:acyl-[acyl-carrier-protein]-phospholipid O-acyltransferase/long-chain-fatty-acid--[acyl-carrier-protein] ligase